MTTYNDIFRFVNKVKPTPYKAKYGRVSFELIEDSRFEGKTVEQMLEELMPIEKELGVKVVTSGRVWNYKNVEGTQRRIRIAIDK